LFDGRWGRGHSLWGNYPDIAKDLCTRADEVLVQRKLIEPKPDKDKEKEEKDKKAGSNAQQRAGAKAGPSAAAGGGSSSGGGITVAKIDAEGNDIKADADADEHADGGEEGAEDENDDDFLDAKVEGRKTVIPDDPFEGVMIPQFSDGEEEPDNLSLNMRKKVKNKV
jgi:hypothetical protein